MTENHTKDANDINETESGWPINDKIKLHSPNRRSDLAVVVGRRSNGSQTAQNLLARSRQATVCRARTIIIISSNIIIYN